MSNNLTQEARVALEPLANALAADGYELQVEQLDARLELIVTPTTEVCAECLVPKTIFKNMAEETLRNNGVIVEGGLQITYPKGHHEQ
jgi:hypothetical protein